ncbi:MAG: AAA family ATPase [Dysgonamonadaceae bacterium]|jgi:predicted ATP-binding protein involved in virulence|nr:AAA family ATPase [Dysgonamonadaceae bacterium]
MEVKNIKIRKLFGLFDYNIELNQSGSLTVLTGPNGYGKTTILNIIYSLFNQRFFYFQKLNFELISFYFINGQQIDITKKKGKDKVEQSVRIVNNQQRIVSQNIETVDVHIRLLQTGTPIEAFIYNSESENKLVLELGKYIPVHKISQNIVLDSRTGKQFSLRDFLIENINFLPLSVINLINKQGSVKISELLNATNVYLIREERLLTQTRNPNQNVSFDRTIEKYAEELKALIAQKQLDAYKIAQQLDGSFPKRLIECKEFLSESDFKSRFADLTKKQALLKTFGIATTIQDITEYNNETKNVLTVYLEDSEAKVRVYDELLNKIELFVNILNEKMFAFKSIVINGSQGFYFQLSNGQKLKLTDLSSGEQQEVVLQYELLFKTNPDTLILIDEPEISLHVMWQKAFIQDLQRIAKIKQISFLVSTHAPQIINDNWDLTRDLYELSNAE